MQTDISNAIRVMMGQLSTKSSNVRKLLKAKSLVSFLPSTKSSNIHLVSSRGSPDIFRSPDIFPQAVIAQFPVAGCKFLVSGYKFLVSGCKFMVSGCKFLLSGCKFLLSGCQFMVSGCQFMVSGCQFMVSGCQFMVSGCKFLLSGCKFLLSGCQVLLSGCQFMVSGCQFMISGCKFMISGCKFMISGCKFLLSGCKFMVSSIPYSGCQFLSQKKLGNFRRKSDVTQYSVAAAQMSLQKKLGNFRRKSDVTQYSVAAAQMSLQKKLGNLRKSDVTQYSVAAAHMSLEKMLGTACQSWQFVAFSLNTLTNDRPLSTLGYYLFHSTGLISDFKLKPSHLIKFLCRVEQGYKSNPYHSRIHATDVLQKYYVILTQGGLVPGYVDKLTLLGCLLAAIVHVYEHVGLTNDFLVNSGDSLAIRYNDRAPMENHHLAAAFDLLQHPDYNFTSEMHKKDQDTLRKLMIDLVLATDMKQHFSLLAHFRTVHRIAPSTCKLNSVSGDYVCDYNDTRTDSATKLVRAPLDESERLMSLQVALKMADLSHLSAKLPVHLQWVAALEEEFFRQGDSEMGNGMPASPLFDRTKQGISKSQVGFLDIIGTKPMFVYVMHNYKHWMAVEPGSTPLPSSNSLSRGSIDRLT
eukprot:gene23244-30468_t